MKLLLRRDQKSGMLGGSVTFMLEVRASLSQDELAHIKRYKLGKTLLYTRREIVDPGKGLLGLGWRLAFKMLNLTVHVEDLVDGKWIDCKDIVEMLAVEEQINEACETFKLVLQAAAHFGGEESDRVRVTCSAFDRISATSSCALLGGLMAQTALALQ